MTFVPNAQYIQDSGNVYLFSFLIRSSAILSIPSSVKDTYPMVDGVGAKRHSINSKSPWLPTSIASLLPSPPITLADDYDLCLTCLDFPRPTKTFELPQRLDRGCGASTARRLLKLLLSIVSVRSSQLVLLLSGL
jgi:hypothetical protein